MCFWVLTGAEQVRDISETAAAIPRSRRRSRLPLLRTSRSARC